MDKGIRMKDFEDMGFPWMDDNKFCCNWVQLGPHGQGRNDASFYCGKSTRDPSMKYFPRCLLRWLTVDSES